MNLAKYPIVRAAGIRLLQVHQLVYERSGGRVGHRLLGVPSLLLRTVGAKTGRPRTSALNYAKDGDRYVVVASMGGAPRSPGWYHNLKARPDVEIQVGTRRIPGTASALLPADADYARLWRLANDHNAHRYDSYQKLTSRPIPVVVLTPRS